jgi:hypothetical protein
MKTTVKTNSECTYQLSYNDKTQVLTVVFQYGPPKNYDGTYKYKDVPPDVFEAFMTAESKGKFFNHYIRNEYELTD